MIDDRPIKPDLQYLKTKQQAKNKKRQDNYLRKKSIPILPCHQRQEPDHQKSPQIISKQKHMTKAQIYNQIKIANRQKFGQWKKPNNQQIQQQKKQPKIKPSAMTVPWKRQNKIIDTTQYKKPGVQKVKKTSIESTPKIQYQKMLEKLGHEMHKLKQEKQQFEKKAQALKWKQSLLSNFDNPFKHNANATIRESEISKIFSQNHQINNISALQSSLNKAKKALKNSISRKQIHKKAQNQDQDKSLIYQYLQQSEPIVKKNFSFSLTSLIQLPNLSLKTIYQCIDINQLYVTQNQFYIQATETQYKSERQKVNEYQDKRITQYANKWVEIWSPGKQRLMTNNKGYTIVWFSNGDVKQTFPKGIISYFCKARKVVKISIKQNEEFYFFPDLRQLQKYHKGKNQKEVIYQDGHYEIRYQ